MKTTDRKHPNAVTHALAMLTSIPNVDESLKRFDTERTRQNKSLVKSLRPARIALGVSSQEVAKRVGITQGHYSDVERGRRSCTPELAIKLRDYFRKVTE